MAGEKAREVAMFGESRRSRENYRPAHFNARGGEGWIDPEVLPLVDALNTLEGVCTVQSCCGHRHPIPDDPDGAEWVHHGQLWLRLSESVSRNADERVGVLLAHDVIVHVQKLYSYPEMSEPHEVFDVQFRDGHLESASRVIEDFFTSVARYTTESLHNPRCRASKGPVSVRRDR
jgi:tRNA(Phe) wybutosine-synthesizing methylase Tyw3